jgi:hypothetical protein
MNNKKKDGKKNKERRPVVCCGTLCFGTMTVTFIGIDMAQNWPLKLAPKIGPQNQPKTGPSEAPTAPHDYPGRLYCDRFLKKHLSSCQKFNPKLREFVES